MIKKVNDRIMIELVKILYKSKRELGLYVISNRKINISVFLQKKNIYIYNPGSMHTSF